MALPVRLQDVVDQMDLAGDAMAAYINRDTGELVTLSDADISLAEEDDADPDAADWQKEVIEEAKKVLADDNYIVLPGQFEIHEYSIMERFCVSISDEQVRDVLLEAIQGRGAFRRFKNRIIEEGVREDWFAFRNRALKKIAADFLDSHGIAYLDE